MTNKKSKIYLNTRLAKKMGIQFPVDLLESAQLISAEQKKLLYIDSYHREYPWSADLRKGLLKALNIQELAEGQYDTTLSLVKFKSFHMNTKLNTDDEYKKQAALEAKKLIEQWQPDIVVASDDNAAKYLIVPYYKNTELPFVFCGINWDASVYGLPASNITGMVEVAPVVGTIEMLKKYARGERLALIGSQNFTTRKESNYHKEVLNINYQEVALVPTFQEWKQKYLELQESVDMLFWLNPIGIKGWDVGQAIDFIQAHTKIPTGGSGDNLRNYVLLGRFKIAEEQGWWSGKTALKILAGTAPGDIPVTTNKESKVMLNMPLAKVLGIKFPMELIEEATLVGELPDKRGEK